MWVEIGGYETVCAEPPDHDGPCRPRLVELLGRLRGLADEQQAIADFVWKETADDLK